MIFNRFFIMEKDYEFIYKLTFDGMDFHVDKMTVLEKRRVMSMSATTAILIPPLTLTAVIIRAREARQFGYVLPRRDALKR